MIQKNVRGILKHCLFHNFSFLPSVPQACLRYTWHLQEEPKSNEGRDGLHSVSLVPQLSAIRQDFGISAIDASVHPTWIAVHWLDHDYFFIIRGHVPAPLESVWPDRLRTLIFFLVTA